MPVSEQEVFQTARATVVNSISNFIERRANATPTFQILDLIIPTERKIRSIVGGMETSLGTTLWEPLAKNLARLNDFEVVNSKLQRPAIMPANLSSTVQLVINGRLSGNQLYSAQYCHDRIREVCQEFIAQPIPEFINANRGYGVDIWLRKNDINYIFDTKTVQANVGAYTSFLHQIMNWYSFFYARFPQGRVEGRIVFPYNPHRPRDFWTSTMGGGSPLIAGIEGWVENEFWDFCSGIENTYQIILNAFNDISSSGDLEEIIQEIFYGGALNGS